MGFGFKENTETDYYLNKKFTLLQKLVMTLTDSNIAGIIGKSRLIRQSKELYTREEERCSTAYD